MGKFAYFMCVDAKTNHNKFYKMVENDDSTITVNFGREGTNGQTKTYRPYEKSWTQIYNDRIAHGYKDITASKTDVVVDKKNPVAKYKDIEDTDIKTLVDSMIASSRQFMQQNYTIKESQITQKMLDECYADYRELQDAANKGSVYLFNKVLVELFTDNARKMSKVENYIAKDPTDFDKILQRESDMLDTLRQIFNQQKQAKKLTETKDPNASDKTILEANGVTMEAVTYAEEDYILKKLSKKNWEGCSNENTFVRAIAVRNQETEDRYNKYSRDINAGKEGTHIYFHGTRFENLWSIINTGLSLNPNAVTTGKAFGQGIYFAEHSQKSRGYTSIQGSRWASGGMQTGMLLMYEVATGKSYKVDSKNQNRSRISYSFRENDLKRLGNYDSVYAVGRDQPNGIFMNSEIMVYNQNACTIRYMVEFDQKAHNFTIPYEKRAKMEIEPKDISVKEKSNGELEFTIKTLPDNMSFLRKSITTENNIIVKYNKDTDTISLNGNTTLSGYDKKWLMRTIKKAYVDSEKEWKALMESPDKELLGIKEKTGKVKD